MTYFWSILLNLAASSSVSTKRLPRHSSCNVLIKILAYRTLPRAAWIPRHRRSLRPCGNPRWPPASRSGCRWKRHCPAAAPEETKSPAANGSLWTDSYSIPNSVSVSLDPSSRNRTGRSYSARIYILRISFASFLSPPFSTDLMMQRPDRGWRRRHLPTCCRTCVTTFKHHKSIRSGCWSDRPA